MGFEASVPVKQYDLERDVIVFCGASTSSAFWDTYWARLHRDDLKEKILSGLSDRAVLRLVQQLVDPMDCILEGGCGIGQYVYLLHKHGYNVVGLDYAADTVARSKELFPELALAVADLRRLPLQDGQIGCYLSFGVIEHFHDGYDRILREAHRVLKKGGYLVVTFPQISPLRRMKIRLGCYGDTERGTRHAVHQFYQYAFPRGSVSENLREAGFQTVSWKAQNGAKGFYDEAPIIGPIVRRVFRYPGRNVLTRSIRFLLRLALDNLISAYLCGHTCQLVARKV